MKKFVLVFIISTMIATGVAGKEEKEKIAAAGPQREIEIRTEQNGEEPDENTASIKELESRFYVKIGEFVNQKIQKENVVKIEKKQTQGQLQRETQTQECVAGDGTERQMKQKEEIKMQKETEQQEEVPGHEESAVPQMQAETVIQAETVMQAEAAVEPENTVQPQLEGDAQQPVMEQPEPEVQSNPEPEVQTKPQDTVCAAGITLSDEDYVKLQRIVEAEAGDQDDIGKILVANVVFNRVKNTEFPGTVTEVIYQHGYGVYQFEPVLNGRIDWVTVSDSTRSCVDRAIAGEDYSQGALYFTMRTSENSWFNTSLRLLFVHGDHYFYTC